MSHVDIPFMSKVSMVACAGLLVISFLMFCIGFFGDNWYQSRLDPSIRTGFFQSCFQGGCVSKPESKAVLLQTIGFVFGFHSILLAALTVFIQLKDKDRNPFVFIGATLSVTVLATIFIIAGWSVSKQNISLTMMVDFIPAWSYNIVIAGFSLFLVSIIVNGIALVLTCISSSVDVN
jgi:hypothetical protein